MFFKTLITKKKKIKFEVSHNCFEIMSLIKYTVFTCIHAHLERIQGRFPSPENSNLTQYSYQ